MVERAILEKTVAAKRKCNRGNVTHSCGANPIVVYLVIQFSIIALSMIYRFALTRIKLFIHLIDKCMLWIYFLVPL